MARDGEIQNRSLLQSMADYLNIGGVKRAPKFLNTDDVKAVYIVGQEAVELFSLGKTSGGSVAGESVIDKDISGTLAGGVSSPMFHNDNYAMEVVGLTVRINYTPGGAAVDAGLRMSLQIARWQQYTSFDENIVTWLLDWNIVAAGTLDYIFALGGYTRASGVFIQPMPNLYIPAGDQLTITMARQSAAGTGVFPPDTTVSIFAHALMRPRQEQAP